MPTITVVCRNPECAVSFARRPKDPQPMTVTGETSSAWAFKCDHCGGRRVVTKDQIGGTLGQGKTDQMRGKGLTRYTQGVQFTKR